MSLKVPAVVMRSGLQIYPNYCSYRVGLISATENDIQIPTVQDLLC